MTAQQQTLPLNGLASGPSATSRGDYLLMAEMVEQGSKVLDVGCGEGDLLQLLETRGIDGRGIELSREGVNRCVAKGLAVVQGDADTDLVNYPDDAFDYVILSQTLQATRQPRVVLENLLANAWKYTRDCPAAQIAFGRGPEPEPGSFCVRDNGIGFDMDEQALLYQPFRRLSSAQGFPGTDIGLATVQRIVARHGGTLTAAGRPGQGASFTFTLP